ncbi:putative bifunctional diguanylate cyclase/phosphodiesterase [Actinomarinicola tropica]|uniref:EAL domain-containing protein n=1 Tax=Actinomarinicola tropica TaxID=2789776 RepID=A0A5Q2RPV0_9ACTN|nr:bifunctional diguanylate cyclase/phosphodiesterase [Actinomarinicola tropica]QGG96147.1 EAL domain-containing protein [Actinomarinicola tropica]
MDRWERRLQLAARVGAADDAVAQGVARPGQVDAAHGRDPMAGLDRDVAGSIHPDEVATIRSLLDIAARRPSMRVQLPLLVREGADWVQREFEIVAELMGPVLRPAGAQPHRRRRTDADGASPLDRGRVLAELREAIERNAATGVAVLLVDLDRFKRHNDALGEEAGDEILRAVGGRIAETVGRAFSSSIGSDEYLVVLDGVADLARAREVAEKLRLAISRPLAVHGAELVLTATIGVAIGGPGTPPERLLRDADTAVFEGKDHGRDRTEVFDDEMSQRTDRRIESTQTLRRALDDDALELHYQPIVSLDTGVIVGAEALLRIHGQGEGHQLVRPARLIDAAEDLGIVDRLGRFVLERTAAQIATWEPLLAPNRRFRVSVNVSPVQIATPAFTTWVAEALRSADLDPGRLSLELTESIFLDPDPDVDAAVSRLVELGVSFGLDDFGADRSSFGGLRRFPIDFVKLDRAIVADIDSDGTDEVIGESAIGLARQLGFTTVAVGVERESQRDVLRRIGCDAAQGFLFAPPLPPEELAERL